MSVFTSDKNYYKGGRTVKSVIEGAQLVRKWVNNAISNQSGQTMTEYAIVLAFIVAAVIAAFAIFTPGLAAAITAVLAQITAAI